MRLKSVEGLTLIELLIAATILAGAMVFVFQSFMAVLSAGRLSQNIILACFFADNKLQEIEQKQKEADYPLEPASGREEAGGRDFAWSYKAAPSDDERLLQLWLVVSWQEKIKEKPYSLEFSTYLMPER